jgi:uncharacterized membrane protein (UPF0127 family)
MRRQGQVTLAASWLIVCSLLAGCSASAGPDRQIADPSSPSSTGAAETASVSPTGPSSSPPTLEPSEPFGADRVTLTDGETSIPVAVHVADTPALRARGLMEQDSLAAGTGMVFVYAEDTTGSFWMRDTLIPLSIAFADASGRIVGMYDMDPCEALPCPTYGPDEPYRTALEVPQGWFAANDIDAGWRLTGVPS